MHLPRIANFNRWIIRVLPTANEPNFLLIRLSAILSEHESNTIVVYVRRHCCSLCRVSRFVTTLAGKSCASRSQQYTIGRDTCLSVLASPSSRFSVQHTDQYNRAALLHRVIKYILFFVSLWPFTIIPCGRINIINHIFNAKPKDDKIEFIMCIRIK